ncbi:hypothetical protein [Pseudomonas sp. dw_612]|uniref:hypothetical protein n=1 Tax=Pseudomonas sp. dw_612 TaxID=2720080 RepID=UPI001BD4A6F8|nr:hypothetical protein [Pseudomonas sp. dw_612]
MARYFKHPESDKIEEVDAFQVLATLFFGLLYLFCAELWVHLTICLVVGGIAAAVGGPWFGLALISLHVIYAASIRRIVATAYLKKGWIEVQEPKKA